RSREEPNLLPLETWIRKFVQAGEGLIALPVNKSVGRVVIRIGIVDQASTLGIAHDEVASLASHGLRDIARRLREPTIVELVPELLGDELGELILEALPLVVGEGHVVRVGANAQESGRPCIPDTCQTDSVTKQHTIHPPSHA